MEKFVEQDRRVQQDASFFGHPRGLLTLFNLELWERFSYLGFQAILALYFSAAVVEGGLGYEQSTAASIVAAYGALVYLLSIVGAWIADRMVGTHRAVLWGAVIIAAGHIFMGVPGEAMTWIGLGLIIVGTGLLKPNVSTKVGELYAPGDQRRDAGFSIYYAGINIGAFLGPLVAGWLGQNYNWHLGFGAAAVGMILGVIQYVMGARHLGGASRDATIRGRFTWDATMWRTLALVAAVVVAGVVFATSGDDVLGVVINLVSAVAAIVPVVFLVWMYRSTKVTPQERRNILPYAFLLVALVMYNLTYFQTGNTLNFVALEKTDNTIGGFEYPSTWYISLTAIVEIIMGPVLAWLWIKLGRRQPHVAAKVGIGTVLGGFAFVLIALGGMVTPGGALLSSLWLIGCYIFLGLGDLILQTSGMSATTKLAPRAFVSQTMAMWFAAMALSQGIQAQIVKFFSYDNMVAYYGIQAIVIIGYGILLIALTPWMKRRMTDVG
ncbi:peptide MFS transporter [Corynebacterium guangdongense]|uniref:POT family proton-dependent oligopeptide transporter n=1 Tax=Corynebacterium guangdongense TaxID=1783348 RepID=A0ABU2A0K7_9CORY|nr:peptide MFS transporter [Corynebacterium guangdongense]MDR7330625.1 POT family proton-dependent oligopeptide transporter [Corynebacterium guangdongense]WJZ16641.1 Di-/tripeptide transporter [Corynebacterium guangdongense]